MQKRRERRHALDILHVPRLSVLPNFELLDCAPADGITAARNKRDSACPATALRPGYIKSADGATAAFGHEASISDDRSDFRCWGESGPLLEIVTRARLTLLGPHCPVPSLAA